MLPLLFCPIALLVGTMEDPPNNHPAQHVAASNVTTKNDFLIMNKTPWENSDV
jgi:hypothetical protein